MIAQPGPHDILRNSATPVGTNAAILLLPAAVVSLSFGLLDEAGWRLAFLRALVVFGSVAAIFTELLGAAHLLRFWPIVLLWLAVSAGGVVAGVRRKTISRWPIEWKRPELPDVILALPIAAILAVLAVTAVVSPPNSTDALAYHLPRIIYWKQAASVASFPASYLNQIMLQPMAEYLMLHTYLLSGGDRFVNLVQWLGFCGSIVGVSVLAGFFGASRRGQALAALFCSTLPNGVLQASGAKNDCLLALWLVALCCFGYRFIETRGRSDLLLFGLSLALALFTKGTAYLYAPSLVAAILAASRGGLHGWRMVGCGILCTLVINGPLYARNVDLSGSPLGFDSAHGDGFFRWRNERFGWRPLVSNFLRHASDQLGSRSERWNRAVYDFIVKTHQALDIDPNDPATTWRWTVFEPPRNANHETNANNRWHLAALLLALPWCWLRRRAAFWHLAALAGGFLLFCGYLKWQLFEARLLLPLFVLAAPAAGLAFERLRPAVLQVLLVLFFLDTARLPLLQNWVRPWKGPNSIWKLSRDQQYFADLTQWSESSWFPNAVQATVRSGCKQIGIDSSQFQLEYPYQVLLLERDPGYRFVPMGVANPSARYARLDDPEPCAVLCMNCAGMDSKLKAYRRFGSPVTFGKFVLFAPPQSGRSSPKRSANLASSSQTASGTGMPWRVRLARLSLSGSPGISTWCAPGAGGRLRAASTVFRVNLRYRSGSPKAAGSTARRKTPPIRPAGSGTEVCVTPIRAGSCSSIIPRPPKSAATSARPEPLCSARGAPSGSNVPPS